MNQCNVCGKFRAWEDLEYIEDIRWRGASDNMADFSYHRCTFCPDDKKPSPPKQFYTLEQLREEV